MVALCGHRPDGRCGTWRRPQEPSCKPLCGAVHACSHAQRARSEVVGVRVPHRVLGVLHRVLGGLRTVLGLLHRVLEVLHRVLGGLLGLLHKVLHITRGPPDTLSMYNRTPHNRTHSAEGIKIRETEPQRAVCRPTAQGVLRSSLWRAPLPPSDRPTAPSPPYVYDTLTFVSESPVGVWVHPPTHADTHAPLTHVHHPPPPFLGLLYCCCPAPTFPTPFVPTRHVAHDLAAAPSLSTARSKGIPDSRTRTPTVYVHADLWSHPLKSDSGSACPTGRLHAPAI